MDKITVLFPGGFKPLTGAHLALAQRYAESPEVQRVIMLIGPKDRDGITREKTMEIFSLVNDNPKIQMQPTQHNSPIMAAYEYLFDLPENETGRYAMAASAKGDDYVRTQAFVPNVDKYITIGDKSGRKMPQGIDATELPIDVEPLTDAMGNPISATTVRQALAQNDYETFRTAYPNVKDAIVKNIWQILRGQQEAAVFSRDWWSNTLQEDVEEVIEAVMNDTERNRHNRKISKLQKFLDANPGEPFVYDFNQFEPTVIGVRMTESVLHENYITREELAQIEPTIDRFFRQFGIDVDFQGKFTHFIDRLNDPRNEGTISLDDLENLFQDLAAEYGEDIVDQMQQGNPTAITSDYQFDVPIHMPFQLEFDRGKGQIRLIPRTIKAQRRAWQKNNPNDVEYRIESVRSSKNLLSEGGAAGHMAHPYDDHGLTFADMKELVARALSGRLDIEEAVTEKTDGQNIQVTWKDGQPGFARNKGTIITPLTPDQLIADFERKYSESVAKNGAEAAAGYRNVVEAYRACAEDLTEAMNRIDPARLEQIFKNGRVFANMEIIYPATQNVIAYDKAHLQFHNLVEYDEKANKVQTDMTGGNLLQQIITDANAHMQKTFSFIAPQRIKLGRLADFEDQQSAFFNEIDQLRNRYNLQENDLISDYHKMWWADVIRSKAEQLGYAIPENVLTALIYRWGFFDKSTNISVLKKQIESPEFANWVTEFDKKEFKKYYKQNMEPFESIFLRLGAVVLRNATNFLAANPDKSVQSIKNDLAALIKDLQASPNPDVIAKLKMELRRIEKLGGFDAIVPAEGLVFVFRGNTYKFTGAFAPVNQILGTLKYMR